VGLFGNKSKSENLGSLFEDDELVTEAAVDYNSALNWLTGLSDEDYKKVCTVAEIYRKAEREAAEALGVENTPTTFIKQPEQEELTPNALASTILDDEDADIADILDESNFLEDEPKTSKPKQIEVAEK